MNINKLKTLLSNLDQTPIQLTRQRISIRSYRMDPIPDQILTALEDFIEIFPPGPFGSKPRFQITAAAEDDPEALKGLGTYGFIRDPQGFLLGAGTTKPGAMEDFGFLMEILLLRAVDLGLGTCWLGGTFNRSRFARILNLEDDEIIPSILSLGLPAEIPGPAEKAIRLSARADRRLPWSELFFLDSPTQPLSETAAEDYRIPLEMVRLGPSASNKQPWRILRTGPDWHFYLERTPNYLPGIARTLLGIPDLQRVDIGIALSHFSLSAAQIGLTGSWQELPADGVPVHPRWEYVITWKDQTRRKS
jgi:nitroreductase